MYVIYCRTKTVTVFCSTLGDTFDVVPNLVFIFWYNTDNNAIPGIGKYAVYICVLTGSFTSMHRHVPPVAME